MTTVVATVASGADDAYWDSSSITVTGDPLYIGGASPYNYETLLLFTGLAVPQGATIGSASLGAYANTIIGSIPATTLRAAAADNAAMPATTAAASGLTKTTASTSWKPAAWATYTQYTSPDMSAVVAEVVSRPGWASGNALLVTWDGDGTNNVLTAYSYEGASYRAAALTVDYTQGSSYSGTGALTGSGALTAAPVPRAAQTAAFAGAGSLAASGSAQFPPAAPTLTNPASGATVSTAVSLGWTPDGTQTSYAIRRRRL